MADCCQSAIFVAAEVTRRNRAGTLSQTLSSSLCRSSIGCPESGHFGHCWLHSNPQFPGGEVRHLPCSETSRCSAAISRLADERTYANQSLSFFRRDRSHHDHLLLPAVSSSTAASSLTPAQARRSLQRFRLPHGIGRTPCCS